MPRGSLGLTEPATAADEDDNKDEAPPAAAASSHRPSVSASWCRRNATELRVTARWGDYTPIEFI
jgi:hypothetical protein